MSSPIRPSSPKNIFVETYGIYFKKLPISNDKTIEKLEAIAEEPTWPLSSSNNAIKRPRSLDDLNVEKQPVSER